MIVLQPKHCCINCFSNLHLQNHIMQNYDQIGVCDYCKSENVKLYPVSQMGEHIRECLMKAYEYIDDGTGAMWDDEEDGYIDYKGNSSEPISIREILCDDEAIFTDIAMKNGLLESLFEDVNSYENVKDGEYDIWGEIDEPQFVIRDDLYGEEILPVYQDWLMFKHIAKHYNRFFAIDGYGDYSGFLERFKSILWGFADDLPVGTKLYRARKQDNTLNDLSNIQPYKDMGPAPPKFAQTNRMSPAGISYLYLATDKDTTFSECRLSDCTAIVAEFESTQELQVIDFTKDNDYYDCGSIFSDDYCHEERFMTRFLKSFVKELSQPISDNQDRSYEYVATQIISEYIRSIGLDGICYQSSVANGKNYAFFYGPDPKEVPGLYPYPFNDPHYPYELPILDPYTEFFKITQVEEVRLENITKATTVHTRMIK